MAGKPAVRAIVTDQVADESARVPTVVTPTLLLFAGSLLVGAAAAWLALTHLLTPWLTIPLHVAATCGMFVVVHECVHHTAGRLTWVNDILGRLARPFVSAFGSFGSARCVHLAQHRRDEPGHLTPWNLRGPRPLLPLRWMVSDLWYVWTYLKRTAERPQLELAEALGLLVLVPGTLAAVIATGHGWELAVVYLLPQRIALGLCSWWCDWFPRRQPADARSYHRVHSRNPHVPLPLYTRALDTGTATAPGLPRRAPSVYHPLRVTGVRPLTDRAAEIVLAVPPPLRETFAFTPGQHVEIRLPDTGGLVAREYCLTSCPDEDELRIAVKRVRGGLLSTYLTTTVRPGDELEVRPPAGEFAASPSKRGGHYVAVAAGVGIAPLLPMLAHTLEESPRSRATLLYVNRRGTDTMFAAELTQLVRRFEGRLRVEHFRTDERDPDLHAGACDASPFDSIGSVLSISYERYHRGGLDARRLRSLLASRLHPAKVDEWLVCAPAEVAAALRAVLAEHHVPDDAVRAEQFQVAPEVPVQSSDEPTLELRPPVIRPVS